MKHISDETLLSEIGSRLARRRLDRNLTQALLARQAGVSRPTIERMEGGASTQVTNLIRVLRVLDLLQNIDALIPPTVPSPIQQLRLSGKRRERASRKGLSTPPKRKWQWGDKL